MPSPDAPLTGGCACGAVRYEVTAPFETAGHCHCKRCQRRSGTAWSLNAAVPADAFAIVEGADAIRTRVPPTPPDGLPKSFCVHCGGHLFAGDPGAGGIVGVRLGTVDGDPGIRPQYRQLLESAPEWEPVPDDGVPRFQQRRES
jgi:hypothetical protein